MHFIHGAAEGNDLEVRRLHGEWFPSRHHRTSPAETSYFVPFVYARPIDSNEDLVARIAIVAGDTREIPGVITNVCSSLGRRCEACIVACGGSLKQFLVIPHEHHACIIFYVSTFIHAGHFMCKSNCLFLFLPEKFSCLLWIIFI